jgi:hypothetical protein
MWLTILYLYLGIHLFGFLFSFIVRGKITTKLEFWERIIPFGIWDLYKWYSNLKQNDKEEVTELELRRYWRYPQLKPIRISSKLAHQLLMSNAYIDKNNQTYYYKLVDMGLGVYEVTPVHMAELSSTRIFKTT